jgi:integral membrane protein
LARRHGSVDDAPVPSIRWFRMVALAEAVSYLALLGASVAKRTLDMPELVTVIGPIHGLLFLTYVALALHVRERLGWNVWTTVMVVIAAAVPLGALVVERRLLAEAPPSSPQPATDGGRAGYPAAAHDG